MRLIIANKAYSSWSLRPWLLMRAFEIPFDETVIPLDTPETAAAIAEHSPAGKLPVLHDGEITVWESLAIIDYLAERFPQHAIWPRDEAARALARSVAAEMHAGFGALRRAMPMNMRRAPSPLRSEADDPVALARDLRRIEAIWTDARTRYGGARSPFLFGAFSAADAMFAPVVNRLHAYAVPVSDTSRAYMDAVMAMPVWRDWCAGAEAEGWRLARIDDV